MKILSIKIFILFLLIVFIFLFYSCSRDNGNVVGPINIIDTNCPSSPLNFNVLNNFYCPKLSWQCPIDSGSSKIINYNIYRSKSGVVSFLCSLSSNIYNYYDTTGKENSFYVYYVTAENNSGEGPQSNHDSMSYKSISGLWIFSFIQEGNYTNPPPTAFYVNLNGNFSKSVKLWVGTWSGSDHYDYRTISGKVDKNGKIINGLITGGGINGNISCSPYSSFNASNYSVNGFFYHYVTLGSNYNYKAEGTWSATKKNN